MALRLAMASALLLVTAGAVHQGVAFADDVSDPRVLPRVPRPEPRPEPRPDEGCVLPAALPGLPAPIAPCSSPPRRRALEPGWCVTPAVFYGDPRPRSCAERPRLAPGPAPLPPQRAPRDLPRP